MPTEDSDPAIDWGPDALTAVDDPVTSPAAHVVPEADTDKFQSLDFALGREKGFEEGVERVGEAIVSELLRIQFNGYEASRWRSRIEGMANEKAPWVGRR